MMRNDSSRTALALILAFLVSTPVWAAHQDKQTGSEKAAQKVAKQTDSLAEQPKTEANTEANTMASEVAPEAKAGLVDNEPVVDEGDPLPEPEEVLKTKTKSNQSND